MSQILAIASTAFDLLLVVVGFGLIIVVHELGHFLAARWAGIRVFAFAVGFGPAFMSYRKGLGWRRGSSEGDYRALLADRGLSVHDAPPADISPTEYRLNALPFGGYVKMLGQEDANPGATSHAADSYQKCHPAKRLVVISAGVVANVILAAFVFMFVFMVGLKTEPPRIGLVASNGPASSALPREPQLVEPGLRPGDEIVRVNGREARSFNDLMLASAMARPGRPVEVHVRRTGFDEPLIFDIVPTKSQVTGLQDIGIAPAQSNRIFDDGGRPQEFASQMARLGLAGIPAGAEISSVRVGEGPVRKIEYAAMLSEVFESSAGVPVTLIFDDQGLPREVRLEPRPEFQTALVPMPGGAQTPQTHLLGLTPVMTVGPLEPDSRGYAQGLRAGDVFARLGSLEYPSIASGIAEIRRHTGRTIPIVVVREGQHVPLRVEVNKAGQIGFYPDQTLDATVLALPPMGVESSAFTIDRPGVRLLTVGDREVEDFAGIRRALRDATAQASAQATGASVMVEWALPTPGSPRERHTFELSEAQVAELHDLGYGPPQGLLSAFVPAEYLLRADGPIDAVRVGLAETHRVMMMTYLTFARLFQGSVKVEHLKGPVGIAHLGTRVADRGIIWLLFFMALISVNLAVVNFLPLPIVDGGQFLFIIYEWVRGRPVPEAVQGIATVAGLLLIGAAFLIITFNDIRNVFIGL